MISLKGVLVLGICALIAGCSEAKSRNSPQRLFEQKIGKPIPASVQQLQAEYSGGREWKALFYFKIAPEDGRKLIRELGVAPVEDAENLKDFREIVYPRFKSERLPDPERLRGLRVYAADNDIVFTCVLTDESLSEMFILRERL